MLENKTVSWVNNQKLKYWEWYIDRKYFYGQFDDGESIEYDDVKEVIIDI